jgi:hypothetical protein
MPRLAPVTNAIGNFHLRSSAVFLAVQRRASEIKEHPAEPPGKPQRVVNPTLLLILRGLLLARSPYFGAFHKIQLTANVVGRINPGDSFNISVTSSQGPY